MHVVLEEEGVHLVLCVGERLMTIISLNTYDILLVMMKMEITNCYCSVLIYFYRNYMVISTSNFES